MNPADVIAVILAAGQGKRMKSPLPKVLAPVLGRPMVRYVLDTCQAAGLTRVVLVVGHMQQAVRDELGPGYVYAEQTEQLGTGHAVMMARETIAPYPYTLVLNGDCPLLTPAALRALFDEADQNRDLVFLSIRPSSPQPYGRVLRDTPGRVTGVVLEKAATPDQLAVGEMNRGLYHFRPPTLLAHLDSLGQNNSQGEYYITDLVGIFLSEGLSVQAVCVDETEVLGANTSEDVAVLEEILLRRIQTQTAAP